MVVVQSRRIASIHQLVRLLPQCIHPVHVELNPFQSIYPSGKQQGWGMKDLTFAAILEVQLGPLWRGARNRRGAFALEVRILNLILES